MSSQLAQWTISPAILALTVALGVGYTWALTRLRASGQRWPAWRSLIMYGLVLPGLVITICWWPAAMAHRSLAAYMTQLVLLSLIIPVLITLTAPVLLVRRASGEQGRVGGLISEVFDSRPIRLASHPLITALILLALPVLVVFTGLLRLTLTNAVAFGAMQVIVLLVGTLAVLSIVDGQVPAHSIAYPVLLFFAFFELIVDAIPGAILFFTTTLVGGGWYALHGDPGGLQWAHDDQHTAGAILWAVGEGMDVPFLLLILILWMRADAAEAKRIDAVLDAQDALRLLGD